MQENLTEQVMVRLTPEVRKALERKAEADHRKMSDYLRLLIERDVKGERSDAAAQPANGNAPADAA